MLVIGYHHNYRIPKRCYVNVPKCFNVQQKRTWCVSMSSAAVTEMKVFSRLVEPCLFYQYFMCGIDIKKPSRKRGKNKSFVVTQ